MKSKFFLYLFFLVFLSCAKENEVPKGLTYSDFENNLKPDMSYSSIVAEFGEPAKDIGSGIHIYVYQLNDSSEIWIGFTDRIVYARHMDKNHLIINTIIGVESYSPSYKYFRDNLKSDMTYDSMVAKFGVPAKDIGSGIHIYVYQLPDSLEIWIGFTRRIVYARLMDKNREIIESIF